MVFKRTLLKSFSWEWLNSNLNVILGNFSLGAGMFSGLFSPVLKHKYGSISSRILKGMWLPGGWRFIEVVSAGICLDFEVGGGFSFVPLRSFDLVDWNLRLGRLYILTWNLKGTWAEVSTTNDCSHQTPRPIVFTLCLVCIGNTVMLNLMRTIYTSSFHCD